MSVINQVLKDLDKRGAISSLGEETIRVVHMRSHRDALLLIAAGAVGMLIIGGIVWLFVQPSFQPLTAPVAQHATVKPPVQIMAVSQPVVTPVKVNLPHISGISPERLLALGTPQLLSINGLGFKPGVSVDVYDESGRVYPNRPISSFTEESIALKVNLGRKPASWMVEVRNQDGTTSGKYKFEVKSQQQAKEAEAHSRGTAVVSPVTEAVQTKTVDVSVPNMSKQATQLTLPQQAENEFRRAYQLMRQGRNSEAMEGFENALKLDAGHEQARQNLAGLLVEKKRNQEAEHLLKEGLQLNVRYTSHAMLLARLQMERNEVANALQTLQMSLPYAEKNADFQSFVAALMQRQNRHKEAIEYFRKALQLRPNTGVWLMGLGISLRAEKLKDEAADAFKRALGSNSLNAELQAFVTQQLKEL